MLYKLNLNFSSLNKIILIVVFFLELEAFILKPSILGALRRKHCSVVTITSHFIYDSRSDGCDPTNLPYLPKRYRSVDYSRCWLDTASCDYTECMTLYRGMTNKKSVWS